MSRSQSSQGEAECEHVKIKPWFIISVLFLTGDLAQALGSARQGTWKLLGWANEPV
jgi:hypothetical protein